MSQMPTITDLQARAKRFREGLALHEIESNPLTAEDLALFAEFERQGLSDDQIRERLKAMFAQSETLAAE